MSFGSNKKDIAELCNACVMRNIARVTEIVSRNSDFVNASDSEGFPPLLIASLYDVPSAVKILITNKASVNQFDLSKKCSPLLIAAQGGLVEITEILLEASASPNCNLQDVSPLLLASKRGHTEVVELLLENQASVNFTTPEGMTALYSATREGHADVMAMLLRNGAADTIETSVESYTPLLIASYFGHAEVVAELIQQGANMDASDDAGCTCLHLAASCGHLSVLKAILNDSRSFQHPHRDVLGQESEDCFQFTDIYRCDIDRRQEDGATAFFLASQECFIDSMHFLARCKADVGASLNTVKNVMISSSNTFGIYACVLMETIVSFIRSTLHEMIKLPR